jgi:hypothetical protein
MNESLRMVGCFAAIILLASCGGAGERSERMGRIVLRADAARTLGLRGTQLAEVDSSAVPVEVRVWARWARRRIGAGSRRARYFSDGSGVFAILIPRRAFENEDVHVLTGYDPRISPRRRPSMALYEAAESYCPAEPLTRREANARDSTDGCLSFPVFPPPVLQESA